MILLEIAVSAPVRQTYSYSLADQDLISGTAASDYIGRRVLVPFGRRPVTGYVLGESSADHIEFEIKPINKVIDEAPLFHAEMVAFFKWTADYYHYPLGHVIKTALPGGLTASPQKIICLAESGSKRGFSKIPAEIADRNWFKKLREAGRLNEKETKDVFASKEVEKDLKILISAGIVAIENTLNKDRIRAKQEICYRISDTLEEFLKNSKDPSQFAEFSVSASGRSLTKAEIKSILLLKEMRSEYSQSALPRKEFVKRYPYGGRSVKKLIGEGLVEEHRIRIFRSPFGDLLPFYPKPRQLSPEQESALAAIDEAIEEQKYKPFLLRGVTGSGKTEVYLRAVENVLSKDKGVLVLVPEIALATQIEAHFISRFKDTVALLHSGLSQGERYDEWGRVLNGEAKVVIGARSAVFAPLQNIGLIIVDEEHDSSFKQEDGLRYNGRDLALVRAKLEGGVAVLGSATPSVTSHYHSSISKFRLLQMNNRIGDKELPDSLLLDLKDSFGKKGFKLFHPRMVEALSETFSNGHQSILLLNRRGFSTSVICRDCGTIVECKHCKVSMNMHRQKNILLCHYCGFQLPGKIVCSTCHSEDLHPVGFGTERVEEEIRKMLPEARITRLDSDVASDRKRFLTILKAMRNNDIDILVGTQIIAKGLHFPNVTLVGIVMADGGLGFPDFRAAEKTYQLITQVTGRAGRGDAPGKVIIQTLQPDHYAITMASQNRYDQLVNKELAIRQSVGFPPYSRLVFIVIEHADEYMVRKTSVEIVNGAQDWCRKYDLDQAIMLLGPAPAPLERLRDRFRYQILIKSKRLQTLHRLTEWISSTFKSKGQTKVIVDIDPENML